MDASSQDSADLLDVIGIVACHMDDQILDRDAATLGMDAIAFPLFWRDVLEELQVRIAKQSE